MLLEKSQASLDKSEQRSWALQVVHKFRWAASQTDKRDFRERHILVADQVVFTSDRMYNPQIWTVKRLLFQQPLEYRTVYI